MKPIQEMGAIMSITPGYFNNEQMLKQISDGVMQVSLLVNLTLLT